MRFQTMTSSAVLVTLCTLLLCGCGVSTQPGDVGPSSEEQGGALGGAPGVGKGEPEAEAENEAGEGVTLCHVPPGNPDNAHTITVGTPAVRAHLRHGDHLGACEGSSESDAGTPPPTDGGSSGGGGTDPEPDAGSPGPVDAGQVCADSSQACGTSMPCCSGLRCQAGFCSPDIN
jgi:hypothetical protein